MSTGNRETSPDTEETEGGEQTEINRNRRTDRKTEEEKQTDENRRRKAEGENRETQT